MVSQNEQKTDVKKSQICPIWRQSGLIWGHIWEPWSVFQTFSPSTWSPRPSRRSPFCWSRVGATRRRCKRRHEPWTWSRVWCSASPRCRLCRQRRRTRCSCRDTRDTDIKCWCIITAKKWGRMEQNGANQGLFYKKNVLKSDLKKSWICSILGTNLTFMYYILNIWQSAGDKIKSSYVIN